MYLKVVNLLLILYHIAAAAKPGEICFPVDPNKQCEDINSECLVDEYGDFFCLCVAGYVTDFNAKVCRKIPQLPGENCHATLTPCSDIPNTQCIGSICDCVAGFILDPVKKRCIPEPNLPGDVCLPNADLCSGTIPATTCGNFRPDLGESVCECLNGDVTDVINKKCWTIPSYPGDFCHLTLAPCTSVANTSCTSDQNGDYICSCNGDLVYNPNDKTCLMQPTKPGQSCHLIYTPCLVVQNTNCEWDSAKDDFLCICTEDFVTDFENNLCLLPPKFPGDSCHPWLTPCTEIANTSCQSDSPGSNAYCKCGSDFITDHDAKRCLKIPQQPSDECHPLLASCNNIPNTQCIQVVGAGFYCICNDGYITDNINGRCLLPPQNPGDQCEPSLAPCNLVPKTVCDQDNLICTCINPYILYPVNLTCLLLPLLPGDDCDPFLLPCDAVENTDCCAKPGGGYYCRCINGLVNDPENPRCLLQPVYPMDLCHHVVAPCMQVFNTECSKEVGTTNNRCYCDASTVYDQNSQRCIKIPRNLLEPCSVEVAPCNYVPKAECKFVPGYNDTICFCQDQYVHYPQNNTCLTQPTLPGDTCDPLYLPCDAVTNTTCSENENSFYCKCDGDLINDPDNRICLHPPDFPLDACHPIVAPCGDVPNTLCKPTVGATDFKCHCNTGYFYDQHGKRCITLPQRPGDPCEPTISNCDHITNTTCVLDQSQQYRCECINNLITDPDNGICIQSPSKPGHPCHPNLATCQFVLNTTCLADSLGKFFCMCIEDFYTDTTNEMCVSPAELPGQVCFPGSNLCTHVPNTECLPLSNGTFTCQCLSKHFQSSQTKMCIPFPEFPLGFCTDTSHCVLVDGTTCLNASQFFDGKCVCITGQYDISLDELKCIPKAKNLSDFCESDSTCSNLDHAVCSVDNKCQCTNETFPSLNLTACLFPVYQLGLPCLEDLQCTKGIGSNSHCYNHRCECTVGFKPDEENSRCLEIPNEQRCSDDAECWTKLGEHSHCLNSECQCLPIAELVGNRCEKVLGSCTPDLNCAFFGTGAVCDPTSGYCICPSSISIEYEGQCFKKLHLGDPCVFDFECNSSIVGGAECNSFVRVCSCRQGYQPTFSNSSCVSSSPGSPAFVHSGLYIMLIFIVTVLF